MMPVDNARAKSLFLAAADLADPAERAAYLVRACGSDPELRARIEALLQANDVVPAAAPDGTGAYTPGGHGAAGVVSDPTPLIGAVIANKYTLVEITGEGGMGSVWRAKQSEPVK